MKHQIEQLESMHLVGLRTFCKDGNNAEIGSLWKSLFDREDEVPASQGHWGVSWGDSSGGYHYVCGHHVPDGTPAPDGMIEFDTVAGRYAMWPFNDHPSRMPQTFNDIFKNRLPSAGLTPRKGGICLEFYPPDFMDVVEKIFSIDLYVAVE